MRNLNHRDVVMMTVIEGLKNVRKWRLRVNERKEKDVGVTRGFYGAQVEQISPSEDRKSREEEGAFR